MPDAVSRQQDPRKLGAQSYGQFKILELIGKNALKLDLPPHLRAHNVIHVEHTKPFIMQPHDIARGVTEQPIPVQANAGTLLYEVEEILAHRRRGRGYKWLALMRGSPQHDAVWQPTADFVDPDGTLTHAFHVCIKKHDLLPHLQ